MPVQYNVPFAAVSGRTGRVAVNGTVLAFGKWSTNVQGVDLSVRNFELVDPGFETGVVGLLSNDVSFGGAWNVRTNIFSAANMVVGAIVQNVFLYVSRDPSINQYWLLQELRLLGSQMQCEMDQFVNLDQSGKTNGSFTMPGGISAVPPAIITF